MTAEAALIVPKHQDPNQSTTDHCQSQANIEVKQDATTPESFRSTGKQPSLSRDEIVIGNTTATQIVETPLAELTVIPLSDLSDGMATLNFAGQTCETDSNSRISADLMQRCRTASNNLNRVEVAKTFIDSSASHMSGMNDTVSKLTAPLEISWREISSDNHETLPYEPSQLCTDFAGSTSPWAEHSSFHDAHTTSFLPQRSRTFESCLDDEPLSHFSFSDSESDYGSDCTDTSSVPSASSETQSVEISRDTNGAADLSTHAEVLDVLDGKLKSYADKSLNASNVEHTPLSQGMHDEDHTNVGFSKSNSTSEGYTSNEPLKDPRIAQCQLMELSINRHVPTTQDLANIRTQCCNRGSLNARKGSLDKRIGQVHLEIERLRMFGADTKRLALWLENRNDTLIAIDNRYDDRFSMEAQVLKVMLAEQDSLSRRVAQLRMDNKQLISECESSADLADELNKEVRLLNDTLQESNAQLEIAKGEATHIITLRDTIHSQQKHFENAQREAARFKAQLRILHIEKAAEIDRMKKALKVEQQQLAERVELMAEERIGQLLLQHRIEMQERDTEVAQLQEELERDKAASRVSAQMDRTRPPDDLNDSECRDEWEQERRAKSTQDASRSKQHVLRSNPPDFDWEFDSPDSVVISKTESLAQTILSNVTGGPAYEGASLESRKRLQALCSGRLPHARTTAANTPMSKTDLNKKKRLRVLETEELERRLKKDCEGKETELGRVWT